MRRVRIRTTKVITVSQNTRNKQAKQNFNLATLRHILKRGNLLKFVRNKGTKNTVTKFMEQIPS